MKPSSSSFFFLFFSLYLVSCILFGVWWRERGSVGGVALQKRGLGSPSFVVALGHRLRGGAGIFDIGTLIP